MMKSMLADVSEKRRAEAEEVLRQNGIEDAKVKSVLQKVGLALSGKDLYEQEAENTAMEYLYRDADNYKTWNVVILRGQITQDQKEEIRKKLLDESFIPEQVGLPLERNWDLSEADHCWAELDVYNAFTTTSRQPTEDMSVDELVNRFQAVEAWDDVKYAVEI